MKIDDNSRYVSLTGNDIPKELYGKIIELDSRIFSNDSDEFEGDTAVDDSILLSYLEKNILTTTIIYDQFKDEVIGYYQAFPLTSEFLKKYAAGQTTFADMSADDIERYVPGGEGQKLYIWSIGILDEYRGKCELQDSQTSPLNGKNPMKILVEALAVAIINLKKQGVGIDEIYAEGVSTKGQSLAYGLTEGRVLHEDKENDFVLFGNKFKFENMVAKLPEGVRVDLIRRYNAIGAPAKELLGDKVDELVSGVQETKKDKGENGI